MDRISSTRHFLEMRLCTFCLSPPSLGGCLWFWLEIRGPFGYRCGCSNGAHRYNPYLTSADSSGGTGDGCAIYFVNSIYFLQHFCLFLQLMRIFSNPPPPNFFPTFPILRGSERVLYSSHTYALSGFINVPTNRPIPVQLPPRLAPPESTV